MGGLAIREYLQRIENNIRKWWIDPTNQFGHKVARVVTIGTPHLGSNAACDPTKKRITTKSGIADFNGTSEAIRDLTYEFDSFTNCDIPERLGIYLFGGNEECISGFFKFNNADINCNGKENDNITGINKENSYNPLMPLPKDILYTWIISDVNKGENPTCINALALFCSGFCQDENEPPGDGAVLLEKQYLHENKTITPIGSSYTILTHTDHTEEGKDFEAIIKGLDEPDSFTLAYEIKDRQGVIGLITGMNKNDFTDVDVFKIKNCSELLVVNLDCDINSGVVGVEIYDENANILASDFKIMSSYIYKLSSPVQNTGYSFIIVFGNINNNDSFRYPYSLFVHFDHIYRDITAQFSTDTRFGQTPFTVQFIDESISQDTNITQWLWDFGDGMTSNEANPVHVYSKGGVFTVTLKVKDDYNNIDIIKEQNYIVVSNTNSNMNIVELEYFFDEEPGLGNGKLIPVSPDNNITAQTLIDIAGLSQGFHRLYVRAKDETGTWGIAQSKPFLIQAPNNEGSELNKIVSLEYFFDKDPNIGEGKILSVSTAENVTFQSAINVSDLTQGFHRLYVRAQDDSGTWGIAQSRPFLIQKLINDEKNEIISIEYFIDKDPGIGKGQPFEIINPDRVVIIDDIINIDNLLPGIHRIYVRAKDNNGQWGISQCNEFLVEIDYSMDLLKKIIYSLKIISGIQIEEKIQNYPEIIDIRYTIQLLKEYVNK